MELAGGGLGVDVELAEGFEFGIEELEAEGAGGLEGEEIEDATADGEVAAGGDGGVALVAVLGECFREGRGIEVEAGLEVGAVGEEGFWGRSVLVELLGAEEDGEGVCGSECFEDGEPLGGGFGVLDFEGGVWFFWGRGATEDRPHVGEDEGGDAPEFELGGEALALAGGFVDDPMAFSPEIGCGGAGEGGKEGMRGLCGVVEHDGALAGGEGGQAFREFRGCDGPAKG